MRTYGRVDGVWTEVTTDSNGFDDAVWITTLLQCLKLNLNESPFYSNYGIPAQQSVMTQLFPDFYVMQMQSLFSSYFASLIITKVPNSKIPYYGINIITHRGATISTRIPI